jgi:hypothetical protein
MSVHADRTVGTLTPWFGSDGVSARGRDRWLRRYPKSGFGSHPRGPATQGRNATL